MLFNSFYFWIVFPIIFCIYWLLPKRFHSIQKLFLLIVSYMLYMYWNLSYVFILLGISTIVYIGGILLSIHNNKNKLVVILFVMISIFPLLLFKYFNFFCSITTSIFHIFGLTVLLPEIHWMLPVGISFFTFQSIGYLLDVYHGKIKAEKNIIDLFLFVAFFPQIASGPISKAQELLPQIKTPKYFNYRLARQGLRQLLWGMYIKVVIADRLGVFVDNIYADYNRYTGLVCFVASIFFSFQIYCDFSGYSLMAIGVAKLLGVNLPMNFIRPYFAISFTDFWKRWHITLTQWLRNQIYIPLGGSHCSRIRCYRNILLTFLVSGLWHGANWTYIIWGEMLGFMLIVEKIIGIRNSHGKNNLILFLRMFIIFIMINFSWIFFRMPSVKDSFGLICRFIKTDGTSFIPAIGGNVFAILLITLPIVIIKEIHDEFFINSISWINTVWVRWPAYIFIFTMILTFGVMDSSQFIYVSF